MKNPVEIIMNVVDQALRAHISTQNDPHHKWTQLVCLLKAFPIPHHLQRSSIFILFSLMMVGMYESIVIVVLDSPLLRGLPVLSEFCLFIELILSMLKWLKVK